MAREREAGWARDGMTLVETIAVLFIVGLLVAFAAGVVRDASQSALQRRAEADLHLLADAVERHALRFGAYPGEANRTQPVTNLLALTTEIPGRLGSLHRFSRLLPESFSGLDPWGQPYLYTRHATPDAADGEPGSDTFELASCGPDQQEHTDDDTRL